MDTTENWSVELTAGGQFQAKIKLPRGIFQRDLLLFVITMMPIKHVLRKYVGSNKLTKVSTKKFNHVIYIDDIKRKSG